MMIGYGDRLYSILCIITLLYLSGVSAPLFQTLKKFDSALKAVPEEKQN